MMKRLLALVLLSALFVRGVGLEEGFQSPPMNARPQTWWHWIDGNITRDGITKDLEAMAKVGLGGATILDITGPAPSGPVKTVSPEWFGLVQHAIVEARRLGLEISLHNCPGWSSSGGPWIPKEHAMKRLTHTETIVEGGKRISITLPRAWATMDFYRDIAVLAFPMVSGDGFDFRKVDGVKVSGNHKDQSQVGFLFNHKGNERVQLGPRSDGKMHEFVYEFAEPYKAKMGSLEVLCNDWTGTSIAVSSSDDGQKYQPLIQNHRVRGGLNSFVFKEVTARFYKLTVRDAGSAGIGVRSFQLYPFSRIGNIRAKALYSYGIYDPDAIEPSPDEIIKESDIIDLSSKMDADGKLEWDAPAGRYVICRFGYSLTGKRNHPTTQSGSGLECDKMSKAAVRCAWNGMMGKIVENAGELSGASLKGALIDSYEVGSQNWTDTFAADFKRLRGYDCIRYLPVVTGRFVNSLGFSERFLMDFRRTISDLFAECYSEYFKELCVQSKLDFLSEPYGGPFDNLLQGRYADIPMGEFWGGSNNAGNARFAGNLAQVNGKIYAGAESFTADPVNGRWQSCPDIHKAQGDNVFSQGVNRYIFHSYAHQPWDVSGPGMTMGQWGFHFNRHNTLWPDYEGWLGYVGRAQFMLQQGRIVSDALYVASEVTPCGENYDPPVPYGYHSNACDVRSLLDRIELRGDGRIGYAHGLTFPVLVATRTRYVSAAVLRKLLALAEGGANIVLGERPTCAFGLSGYPGSDDEVKQLASRLWGDLDGKDKKMRSVGKGRVFFGVGMDYVFEQLGLKPDFTAVNKLESNFRIQYLHRRTSEADIYFVSNQMGRVSEFVATFRVSGRVPELWDAETGGRFDAPSYRFVDGMTEVQLRLDQSGSVFVVFRRPAFGDKVVDVAYVRDRSGDEVNQLVIRKAEYRAIDRNGGMDVTAMLNGMVKGGSLYVIASNATFRHDPTPMRVKELYVEYTYNGKDGSCTVRENGSLEIPVGVQSIPTYDSRRLDDGSLEIVVWGNGRLVVDGSGRDVRVPSKVGLSRDWSVSFPAGRGAPSEIKLDALASLSEHSEPGVKYFSGTSRYVKEFELSKDDVGDPVLLDLGNVQVMARVYVNRQYAGLLWKSPYRIRIEPYLKVGKNVLEVRVTNRWVNRLIGDEELPDDATWRNPGAGGSQALAAWPQWFLEGKPSPTGRVAFTTFKHWHKGDQLKPSGLIGPVQLIRGTKIQVKP
ncbi:MAG: hypothetical protein GX561_03250 [Lentisphaerae bacterium]|jgi:hypothetical protein|nr:hypothetical protein [Lentisphaerota bacterium]